MAKHKDFGSGPSLDDLEEVSFTLHGETFECYKAVSGGVILRFGHETMDSKTATGAVIKLFASCMPAGEFERFNDLLTDPDKITEMDTITAIAGYLIETYTARPTKPSPSSGTGPGKKKLSSAR